MENINLIIPEITLFLGICLALMVGVFFKNSFSIVMKLSILILLGVIYLILTDWGGEQKIFLDSFKNDKFSDYFKILILVSSIFIFFSSDQLVKDKTLNKFEYQIIIMFYIFCMFLQCPSKTSGSSRSCFVFFFPWGYVFAFLNTSHMLYSYVNVFCPRIILY